MASPRNSLLQSMPARQFEQIAHLMESVTLAPRRTLQHANVPIKHVYFVEEGLVSVLASTDTRNAVEVWLVGREGVVGSAAVLGLGSTPLRYLVQIGGSALRIGVDDLRQAMADQPQLRALLLDDLHARCCAARSPPPAASAIRFANAWPAGCSPRRIAATVTSFALLRSCSRAFSACGVRPCRRP